MSEYLRYGKYLRLEADRKDFYAQGYKAKFFGSDNFYKIYSFQEILPEIANDEASFKQLMQVVRTTTKLNHANIIRILDFHDFQNCYVLMTEFYPSENLLALMSIYFKQKKSVPYVMAVYMIIQACESIDYAHNMGIIHGNLNPQNFHITHEGSLKISNFGIYQNLSGNTKVKALNFKQFRYLSPEQLENWPVTSQSDIYSLGVILYELITGKVIYSAPTMEEMVDQVVAGKFTPVLELAPNIPEELAQAIEKSLAKEPADRFDDINALKRAIYKFIIQGNKIFSNQHFYKMVSKLFHVQISAAIEANKGYEELNLDDYENLLQPKIAPSDDSFFAPDMDGDLFDDDDEKTSILFDGVEGMEAELSGGVSAKDLYKDIDNEKTMIAMDDEEEEEIEPELIPEPTPRRGGRRNRPDNHQDRPQSNHMVDESDIDNDDDIKLNLVTPKSFDVKAFLMGIGLGGALTAVIFLALSS